MQRNVIRDPLNPSWPSNPGYSPSCPVNQLYQTYPPVDTAVTGQTFEQVPAGPASVKHIYTGIPNWYPTRQKIRPVNSLYGHDYSQYHTSGSGFGKRISYTYKIYPFTNMNTREIREYSSKTLPVISIEEHTKYPVQTTTRLDTWGDDDCSVTCMTTNV